MHSSGLQSPRQRQRVETRFTRRHDVFEVVGVRIADAELFYGHALCQESSWSVRHKRSGTAAKFVSVAEIANFSLQPTTRQRTNRPGHRQYNPSKWVVFTATERAYQPPPFPTRATLLRGSRPLPSRSSSRSRSSQRRAPLPPRLVRSFVTLTVSPRPRVSPAIRILQKREY
jgi:hypothetical protein